MSRTAVPVSCALALAAATVLRTPPEAVYLFDCEGMLQRIEGSASSPERARHVSEIDSTLPKQVRDGCSINAGWYDRSSARLVLVVQTRMWQQNDSVPTKVLSLAAPALVAARVATALPRQPTRPDLDALLPRLRSIRSPFVRSAAYLLGDNATLLLQELRDSAGPSPLPVEPDFLWEAGVVSFRQPRPDATGRYAVYDLAAERLRGAVASAPKGVSEHRVICFTPRGKIYVAAARDTLLVLDVMNPAHRALISDSALDLYWTACAWD
jgi:hypothetical protein